jgi:hypothetical protein
LVIIIRVGRAERAVDQPEDADPGANQDREDEPDLPSRIVQHHEESEQTAADE